MSFPVELKVTEDLIAEMFNNSVKYVLIVTSVHCMECVDGGTLILTTVNNFLDARARLHCACTNPRPRVVVKL